MTTLYNSSTHSATPSSSQLTPDSPHRNSCSALSWLRLLAIYQVLQPTTWYPEFACGTHLMAYPGRPAPELDSSSVASPTFTLGWRSHPDLHLLSHPWLPLFPFSTSAHLLMQWWMLLLRLPSRVRLILANYYQTLPSQRASLCYLIGCTLKACLNQEDPAPSHFHSLKQSDTGVIQLP